MLNLALPLHPFRKLVLIGVALLSGAPLYAADLKAAAGKVQLIIAHRGSSSDRPENTLASYRRAIEAGATAAECDVRTTKDGVLISLHDSTLDRTTNGKGPVSALTLAELRKLDAGSRFDPKYQDERVPTLREILELCKGQCDVLLDLQEKGEGYARKVAEEVRAHGEPRRIILGVRSVAQAKLFRQLLPEARQLGLIPAPKDIESFAQEKVDYIRLWTPWLKDATLVPRVRKAGAKLHLNAFKGHQEEVLSLLLYEPESLACDDPALLRRTLAGIAARK